MFKEFSFIRNYILIICDVPQEKGASRNFPQLFWDTCGKVAGKLWESCGKVSGKVEETCGKVVGSCGNFRNSGNENGK